jgi:hypothetical protein
MILGKEIEVVYNCFSKELSTVTFGTTKYSSLKESVSNLGGSFFWITIESI